jgi:hypothetical protein
MEQRMPSRVLEWLSERGKQSYGSTFGEAKVQKNPHKQAVYADLFRLLSVYFTSSKLTYTDNQ